MVQRSDTNPPTGKPLDEGQLLDWIDGRLSEQDQARLEAASGRPGLRQRVAQMQANARTLRALSVERAPLDLKDRVLAALERDSLVADAEREHPPESLPISLADNVSIRRSARLSRLVPTLALAAGLALLVGGGMYWASLLFRHSAPTTRSGGPMAGRTESPKPEAPPVQPSPAASADVSVASAPTDAALEATALASVESVGPPAPLRMDQAVPLAEAGRLAIRVIGADAAKVRQIENSRRDQDWRLTRTTSAEVALALLPLTARPEREGEPILASSPEQAARLIAPLVGAREAFSPAAVSHVQGAFVLDAVASQSSIEAFAVAVAQRLGADIELAELHTPVHPDPTTESTLWWTQSPAQWTPRVHVPVIIESR